MPRRVGSWIWLVVGVMAGAVVLSQNSPGIYSAIGALAVLAFINFLLFEGFQLAGDKHADMKDRVLSRLKAVWLAYFDPEGVEIRRPRLH